MKKWLLILLVVVVGFASCNQDIVVPQVDNTDNSEATQETGTFESFEELNTKESYIGYGVKPMP